MKRSCVWKGKIVFSKKTRVKRNVILAHRKYSKIYRIKHPDKMIEIQRDWIAKHPEKRKQYRKTFYAKHPGEREQYKSEYYRRYRDNPINSSNSHAIWTMQETELLFQREINDVSLAKKLGRSVQAIQVRRCCTYKSAFDFFCLSLFITLVGIYELRWI